MTFRLQASILPYRSRRAGRASRPRGIEGGNVFPETDFPDGFPSATGPTIRKDDGTYQ